MQGCGVRHEHKTRGPIRLARELSLTGAVASDIRRPPTSRRDHAGSSSNGPGGSAYSLLPRGTICWAGRVSEPADILEAKQAMRARMKAAREAMTQEAMARAGEALAAYGLEFLGTASNDPVVSGFAPLPYEFRLWPLLRRLHRDGLRLALPVMQGKDRPLLFRAWKPGDAMDSGVWGIAEPRSDKPVLDPDILLVPLLAFDRYGWRLGYGGGYYDRTLQALRVRRPIIAVGIGYDSQGVDAVPHLDYDGRLDWVLTPSGPIKCE